jgi:hypothetical protein
MSISTAGVSPFVHIQRAFGWNLGRVKPSPGEAAALAAGGVTDDAMQRYAVWRRSLLLVAAFWTTIAFLLATLDTIEGGFDDLTRLGVSLELGWLAAAAGIALACLIGAFDWKRPARTSGLLVATWGISFFLPFVYALLPVNAVYHVGEIDSSSLQSMETLAEEFGLELDPVVDPATLERLKALQELTIEFVLSGSGYLLLLPAVLSLIPGAANGCLRIKALLPAAQLPGWLLVCAAPAFFLFSVVLLVIVNHAARSPLLVFGVLLWTGAPIWYSLRGKVFVQSQIGEAEAARIVNVKRLVLFTTLIGAALLVAFLITAKVAGMKVVGFHRDAAASTKLEELSEADDEVSLQDVQTAVAESKSLLYAYDLSSWRFAVDFLAKFLVATALFASLVLRATVSAWKFDRSFRASPGASLYDSTVAAVAGGLDSLSKPRLS